MEIDEIIAKREATHGDFSRTAAVAQQIKDVVRIGAGERWADMPPEVREAADQIATKLARLVCGDWRSPEHLRDVAGYAVLGMWKNEMNDGG